MAEVECKNYEECEAPICPINEKGTIYHIWYPDEEVCRSREQQRLPWVRKQKRIAKLGLGSDIGFFTVKMLNSVARISRGMKGADPDDIDSVPKWLSQRVERQGVAPLEMPPNKAIKRGKIIATPLRKGGKR